MKQIPLPIAAETARTFDNFVHGGNGAALAHLRALVAPAAPVYLWGGSGTGKTHLLHALVRQFEDQGSHASWFDATQPAPWPFDETRGLIVIDDCDVINADQQHAAFALFVEGATHAVPLVAAGRLPPVDLPLRDDLRSRLGWGHVFALQPLAEAEVRARLRREADQRGLFLSDEVMDYVLVRFERDLKHLMALLNRLDRFAMATQRHITVPMLKQMLAEEGCQAEPLRQPLLAGRDEPVTAAALPPEGAN